METVELENFSTSKNVNLDGIVGAKMVFITNMDENFSSEEESKENTRETDYLFKQQIFPDWTLNPENVQDVASNSQKAPSATEKSRNIPAMTSKPENVQDVTSNPQYVPDATDSDSELNLHEIEMERRRIIDKQVVRKKIIEQWALKNQKDDIDESKSNEDSLEILRNLNSKTSLKTFPPSPHNSQGSTKTFEKRKEQEKNIADQFRKHQSTRDISKIKEDNTDDIDSNSIIQNKQKTIKYWERLTMAQQTFDGSKEVSPIHSRTEINNSNLVCKERLAIQNEHPKYNTTSQLNISQKEPTLLDLNNYCNDSLNITVNTFSGIENTIALDSLEIEHERIRKSGKSLTRLLDNSQDSSLRSDLFTERLSDGSVGEVEDRFPSTYVNIGHRNIYENKTFEPTFYIQTTAQSFKMETNFIEREIRLQKEKKDMLAKERHNIFPNAINQVSTSDNPSTIVDKIQVPQHPMERLSSSPPSVHQKTQNLYISYNINSRIAMEIQELKERENELRQLRGQAQPPLVNETSLNNENNDINLGNTQSEHSVKYESLFDDNLCSERQSSITSSIQPEHNVTSAISLNDLHGGQHHDLESAFTYRWKENIKVRPLSDQENVETGHYCKASNETPVEREIRLAKEREDALRKERGWLTPMASEGKVWKPHSQSSVSSSVPRLTSFTSSMFSGNTQKMLASSRIQKEIDEQTQREMALRADGHIQTISQERTDSKVARLGEGDITIQEEVVSETIEPQKHDDIILFSTQQNEAPSTHVLSTQSRNMCSDDSLRQIPTQIHGVGMDNAPSPAKLTSVTNGYTYDKEPRNPPSPPNSMSSSNTISLPGRRFIQNPTGNRGISMHKFIASRGREIRAFSSLKSPSTSKLPNCKESLAHPFPIRSSSVVQPIKHTNEHFNTLPPMVISKDNKEEKPPMLNRKSLPSAESKIQEELKELKDREEELRLQRAHLLGSSQPNLHKLEDDDQLEPFDQERSNSNPDLSENGVLESPVDPIPSIFSGQRRRSLLIAQWEQKIQEA